MAEQSSVRQTSFRLEEPVWRKAKVLAASRGLSLAALLRGLIMAELAYGERELGGATEG